MCAQLVSLFSGWSAGMPWGWRQVLLVGVVCSSSGCVGYYMYRRHGRPPLDAYSNFFWHLLRSERIAGGYFFLNGWVKNNFCHKVPTMWSVRLRRPRRHGARLDLILTEDASILVVVPFLHASPIVLRIMPYRPRMTIRADGGYEERRATTWRGYMISAFGP